MTAKRLLDFYVVDELVTNAMSGRGLPSLFSVACKLAALEAICALKVLPQEVPAPWRLRIDLVGLEDLYIDPISGSMYVIHEYEADWHEVMRSAESGWLSKEAVNKLGAEFKADEDKRDDINRGQDDAEPTSNRKRVVITEYWGDILDIDGTIAHERCVCVLGNKRAILKKPTPYEYWPWVFIRPAPVPFGVFGRGLFDEAASLNRALNEFVSLVVDGACASVWGIRQLRQDFLDDPNQVSDGIPQGETLIVGANLPPGEKVLERVDSGQIPNDALNVWSRLDSEFAQSAASTELSLGQLPSKQVRATEAIQLAEQQAAAFTVMSARLERDVLAPLLETCFRLIISNVDKLDIAELTDLAGKQSALKLQSTAMNAPDVLQKAFSVSDITVKGLSAMGERSRDFFRLQQLMQVMATTVLPLAQVLPAVGIDVQKLLRRNVETLGLNWDDIALPKGVQAPVPPMMPGQGAPTGMPGNQPPQPTLTAPGNLPASTVG